MYYFPSTRLRKNHHFTFQSQEEAERFSNGLCDLGITSIDKSLPKRPIQKDEQFNIILTTEEYKKYTITEKEAFLDYFPKQLRHAVQWAQEEIFQHPYPYLTPWLDQSVPPKEGLCPKQLTQFETELDCNLGRSVVRPNHGMVHSIRVAKYIADVCKLFKKYSTNTNILEIVNDKKQVKLLQIMMLFSVSGRVNEAGQGGTTKMNEGELKLSARNYQESRYFSAANFETYCRFSNILDVTSEQFKQCNHALLHMEEADNELHNWNPYITLMSLTHSMDLMRCFPPEWMDGLHFSFEAHFTEHPDYQKDPNLVRNDIFNMLKTIESCQRATGNRIITAIDQDFTYYRAGIKYDLDLFYHCTSNVDYTMDRLNGLQLIDPELISDSDFCSLIGADFNQHHLYFEREEEATLFAEMMYQNYIFDSLKTPKATIFKGKEAFALAINPSDAIKVLPLLTFKPVLVSKVHSEIDTLLTEDGTLSALQLIKEVKAVLYTFNGGSPDSRSQYFKQIEEPSSTRTIHRESQNLGDRRYYRDPKTDTLHYREVHPALPIKKQLPIVDSTQEVGLYHSVSKDNDRGLPKNTIYTKKMPHMLLRPDTKMMFQKSQESFIPVNVILSIEDVHLKGEKYIWPTQIYPFTSFWVGDKAQTKKDTCHPSFMKNRANAITLEALQLQLLKASELNYPKSEPNEILVAATKHAIKAIAISEDNLLHRIALLENYFHLLSNYGIDVPMLIIDGVRDARVYTESMIIEDLTKLILACQTNTTLSEKHNRQMQEKMAESLLTHLLDLSGPINLKDLAEFEINTLIKYMRDSIRLIHGEKSISSLYEVHLQRGSVNSERAWLKTAIILGNVKILRDLIENSENLSALLEKDDNLDPFQLALDSGNSTLLESILACDFESLNLSDLKASSVYKA